MMFSGNCKANVYNHSVFAQMRRIIAKSAFYNYLCDVLPNVVFVLPRHIKQII